MSYNNFKPTIWSAKIQRELEKECTLVMGCNRDFEGEAKQGGRVKINSIGRPTIKTYTGADLDAPEIVPDSSVYLDLDQAKYFNFQVKDIDSALAKGNLMEELTSEVKQAMAEEHDAFVGGLALKAGQFSASTAVSTTAQAITLLENALLQLRENNVSLKTPIFADIPWWFYGLIRKEVIDLDTDNSKIIEGGVVKKYLDMYLRPTNCLANDSTDDFLMIRTKKAITFAAGIDELEAFRPQGNFSDALKGLSVFGGKITRPKELYVIRARAS